MGNIRTCRSIGVSIRSYHPTLFVFICILYSSSGSLGLVVVAVDVFYYFFRKRFGQSRRRPPPEPSCSPGWNGTWNVSISWQRSTSDRFEDSSFGPCCVFTPIDDCVCAFGTEFVGKEFVHCTSKDLGRLCDCTVWRRTDRIGWEQWPRNDCHFVVICSGYFGFRTGKGRLAHYSWCPVLYLSLYPIRKVCEKHVSSTACSCKSNHRDGLEWTCTRRLFLCCHFCSTTGTGGGSCQRLGK
mmetsp:Transcript_19981/g.37312  ORF Transcript_19981/g.37312 Transcript_19981/m.37312 type:complete len:240 (-) Transcript_19981:2359-3078(-)